MLPLLLAQLLQEVKPPKAVPIGVEGASLALDGPLDSLQRAKDSVERPKASPTGNPLGGGRSFSEPMLDALLDSLTAGLNPFQPSPEAGSLPWQMERELAGFRVERKTFHGIRERMESYDLSTGRREWVWSDEMDVELIVVKGPAGIEEVLLIKKIHHRYRDGSTGSTVIREGWHR